MGSLPYVDGRVGEVFSLPGGASLTLEFPYHSPSRRIWVASLKSPIDLPEYLDRYGFPIRYGYVQREWDAAYYQPVYVTEIGGAEMPSAGRPFSTRLVTRLVAEGIRFAPLLLHTGVASLESNEAPYPEYYKVPPETAALVNTARAEDKRVVAVGTTVVRALETVTDPEGVTWEGEGWTDINIRPSRRVRSINASLTGFHEPRSTHLAMLEAFAGRHHLHRAYDAALKERYLWHEFGDLHLILT